MSTRSDALRSERLTAVLESVGRLDQALGQRAQGSAVTWLNRLSIHSTRPDRGQIELAGVEVLERLDQLTDEDVLSLDRRVRSWSEYIHHWGTGNLSRGFVADQATTAQAATAAASFAVSGYTRERACSVLGSFLPWSFRLLAIRTSDWVPQVRAAALDSLKEVGPDEIASHLGLVSHLTTDRSRGAAFSELVDHALHSDAGLIELDRARRLMDVRSRRAAWTLLMKWQPDETLAKLADAARDSDVWLRQWALRHAHETGVDDAVRLDLVSALRADPVGRLRAAAVALGIELGAIDDPALSAALSDSSSAMRSLVQRRLRAAGVDVASTYRARLERQPAIGDLLGLGETGQRDDAGRLSPWLQDPRPGYRRAALLASVTLLRDEAIHTAAELLSDPSPRVARTATRLLTRFRLPNDLIAQLEEQANHGGSAAIKRRAVLLLRPYSWRWLLAILRSLDGADDETATFLKAELADWHRRSARITTGPPKTSADEIQARLGAVSDASARSIAFVLRTSTPPRSPH